MSIDLRQLHDKVLAAAAEGLAAAANHVLDVAQENTPVDKGDLKASGRVKMHGLKAEIGFTDPVSVIVHENMQAAHDNGSAKFLEKAMNSERDEATKLVAASVRRHLGG